MPNRRYLIRALRYVTFLGSPGPDISWITDRLGVSGILRPRHFPRLAEMDIRAIADLREEGSDDPEALSDHGIRFLHLPVTDHFAPSMEQLVRGARWVQHGMGTSRVIVHCKEGVGRSVILACCTLMMDGLDMSQALNLVKSKRWGVALNTLQLDSVREFEQWVLGGSRMPSNNALSAPETA